MVRYEAAAGWGRRYLHAYVGNDPANHSNPTCDASHGGLPEPQNATTAIKRGARGAHFQVLSQGNYLRFLQGQRRSLQVRMIREGKIMIERKTYGERLRLLLKGEAPMAVTYRSLGEGFDETDGHPLSCRVRQGSICRRGFMIKDEERGIKIMYSVYTLPAEQWRFLVFKALKKEGQHKWSTDMEEIERRLFVFNNVEQ
jgi:hypothetical protein